MAVYKEPKTNTWKVYYRYTDWQGERKQTTKRGFLTKREALAWEREQLNKTKADLYMTFASFVETYTADMKSRIKENTWHTRDNKSAKSRVWDCVKSPSIWLFYPAMIGILVAVYILKLKGVL